MNMTMAEISEAEQKLKRYMYLCSENANYTIPMKNQYDFCNTDKIPSFFVLQSAGKEESVLKLIETVNKDCLCVRRETILFVLAACTRHFKLEHMKSMAYNQSLKVCNSSKEFILFIKFAHSLNKNFSHGLRRIVREYYSKFETTELTDLITQCQSYHGWSHRDIIKLCHLKPKNKAQEVLLTYIMKNLEEAKKKIDSSPTVAEVEDVVRKLEKLESLKHCQDEHRAVTLVEEDKYVIPQFPSSLLKSQVVWDTLIPSLGIPDILTELTRLNRLGFLKANSSTLQKINDVFSDSKKCQHCKIQPAQVLSYLKTFERGKPIDPQKKKYFDTVVPIEYKPVEENNMKEFTCPNPLKSGAIIRSLYKLLQTSFRNLHTTSRRMMITIDVRDKMSRLCFGNKSVQCLEAAVLIALSFTKCEKDVTVAVFNDSTVTVVPMEKGLSYNQAVDKLKNSTGGGVFLASTVAWALENKKQIDVFVSLFHSVDSIPKQHKSLGDPLGCLKDYRKTMHLPNTKMINISLGNKNLWIADGSPHILDICGFDHNVPKMIEVCCKGVLQ